MTARRRVVIRSNGARRTTVRRIRSRKRTSGRRTAWGGWGFISGWSGWLFGNRRRWTRNSRTRS